MTHDNGHESFGSMFEARDSLRPDEVSLAALDEERKARIIAIGRRLRREHDAKS